MARPYAGEPDVAYHIRGRRVPTRGIGSRGGLLLFTGLAEFLLGRGPFHRPSLVDFTEDCRSVPQAVGWILLICEGFRAIHFRSN
jgi:hypothetical protein